jgi:hypothetical protein
VTQHGIVEEEPVIYGVPSPLAAECTGASYEVGTRATQEGWICLAAVAVDNVGNRAVSRPKRLCFDNPTTSVVPACRTDKSNPPSCTDGCTLPRSFADRGQRIIDID